MHQVNAQTKRASRETTRAPTPNMKTHKRTHNSRNNINHNAFLPNNPITSKHPNDPNTTNNSSNSNNINLLNNLTNKSTHPKLPNTPNSSIPAGTLGHTSSTKKRLWVPPSPFSYTPSSHSRRALATLSGTSSSPHPPTPRASNTHAPSNHKRLRTPSNLAGDHAQPTAAVPVRAILPYPRTSRRNPQPGLTPYFPKPNTPPDQAATTFATSVPTPNVVSYNTRSYSDEDDGSERRKRLLENFMAMATTTDVFMTQESRRKIHADKSMDILRDKGWLTFRNPNTTTPNSGGTEILVSPEFAQQYILKDTIIAPGYVQSLVFEPNPAASTPPRSTFTLVNIYLPSGNDAVVRARRLSIMKEIQSFFRTVPQYIILAGDWNLTQYPEDSSSKDHFASSPLAREALATMLAHLRVHEVHQTAHTCMEGARSSRLDRFYVSHTAQEERLAKPYATLPNHPHQPLSATRVSDHFPVRLHFHDASLKPGSRKTIPVWLATHPVFLRQVRDSYAKMKKPLDPAKRLVLFKKIVKNTAWPLLKTIKSETQTRACKLTIGVGLLKILNQQHVDLRKATLLANKDEDLKRALNEDLLRTKARKTNLYPTVKKYIDNLIHQTPTCQRKPDNFLRNTSESLPHEKKFLTHLSLPSGQEVWKSDHIAQELKNTWSPIWNRPNPSTKTIDQYLRSYPKKLRLNISGLSLETAIDIITKPRVSSTGQDGIPFQVYKELVDIAAPLLLNYANHLAKGGRPYNSFNFANVHFFPKDDSAKADKHRPITVSNTDNRLVSNILRASITPAIQDLLEDSQHAFRKDASIEDNIRYFNEDFYRHLENQSEYHLLLHDFEKAYDSISRDYLFALLRQIGLPTWCINVIRALFRRVKAFPILTAKHDITINMDSGLKQGDPLSPLLFIRCIDRRRYRLGCV